MDTQEWEIDLVDQVSLEFYDLISISLVDGTELPIWAKHSEHRLGELNSESAKLLLVSKKPITKQQAVEVQAKLKNRSEIGWYFDIK